ncbi:MAG TPA: PspC domain-containing protein [Cyclobacteriaceae bacterium]|nr:PspC domain-containing protein [Cyclobacteriaceae bacterium]
MRPRLTRSKDKIIAGVCAGIAKYFDLETSLVRIGFVLIGFITAFVPMALVYLVMVIVIPEE